MSALTGTLLNDICQQRAWDALVEAEIKKDGVFERIEDCVKSGLSLQKIESLLRQNNHTRLAARRFSDPLKDFFCCREPYQPEKPFFLWFICRNGMEGLKEFRGVAGVSYEENFANLAETALKIRIKPEVEIADAMRAYKKEIEKKRPKGCVLLNINKVADMNA